MSGRLYILSTLGRWRSDGVISGVFVELAIVPTRPPRARMVSGGEVKTT